MRHLPYEKVQFFLVGPGAPHTFRPYPFRVIASPSEAYPVQYSASVTPWQVVNAKQVSRLPEPSECQLRCIQFQSFRSRPARSAFDLPSFLPLNGQCHGVHMA